MICCSASSCSTCELIVLAMAPVSCVSCSMRSFKVSRLSQDSRGCARSANVPLVGSLCALSFLRFSPCRTLRCSSSLMGRKCFIASCASRSDHRIMSLSSCDVRIAFTSFRAISRILARWFVAMFSGFLKVMWANQFHWKRFHCVGFCGWVLLLGVFIYVSGVFLLSLSRIFGTPSYRTHVIEKITIRGLCALK